MLFLHKILCSFLIHLIQATCSAKNMFRLIPLTVLGKHSYQLRTSPLFSFLRPSIITLPGQALSLSLCSQIIHVLPQQRNHLIAHIFTNSELRRRKYNKSGFVSSFRNLNVSEGCDSQRFTKKRTCSLYLEVPQHKVTWNAIGYASCINGTASSCGLIKPNGLQQAFTKRLYTGFLQFSRQALDISFKNTSPCGV